MLTREKAIKEHRKMWRWLAEHPKEGKLSYLILVAGYNLDDLVCDCFLCEFAYETDPLHNSDNGRCKYCPLDWGENACCITRDDKGLYDLWNLYKCAKKFEMASEIARQIAELPERS